MLDSELQVCKDSLVINAELACPRLFLEISDHSPLLFDELVHQHSLLCELGRCLARAISLSLLVS